MPQVKINIKVNLLRKKGLKERARDSDSENSLTACGISKAVSFIIAVS